MSEKYQSLRRALTLFDTLSGEEFTPKRVLAEAIGVDARTVKSYLDILIEFGWPVEKAHGKGFRLSPVAIGAKFSEQDLLLLSLALAHGASSLPQNEFQRLSKKLVALLPETSARRMETLEEAIQSKSEPCDKIDVFTTVGRCLSDPKAIIVADYQKHDTEAPERRTLLPIRLRFEQDAYYVDCYDLDKKGERSFRVDRFVSISLLKQEQAVLSPIQASDQTHRWDFGEHELQSVTIEVSGKLADWLKRYPEHESQELEEREGSFFATYEVRALESFVDWVLSLRGARAIAPAELVEAVKERCRGILENGGTLGVEWG